METKKKRLTLDLDPAFQRRLKAIAALKGVSMRGYCQAAIDRELHRTKPTAWVGCCPTSQTMSFLQSYGRRYSEASLSLGVPPT